LPSTVTQVNTGSEVGRRRLDSYERKDGHLHAVPQPEEKERRPIGKISPKERESPPSEKFPRTKKEGRVHRQSKKLWKLGKRLPLRLKRNRLDVLTQEPESTSCKETRDNCLHRGEQTKPWVFGKGLLKNSGGQSPSWKVDIDGDAEGKVVLKRGALTFEGN